MKKQICYAICKDLFMILLALFLVIVIKEGAHFIAGSYYHLEPGFGISIEGIGATAKVSSDVFISRVMNMVGIFANITLAIISILFLFVLQVYLPKEKSIIRFYSEDLYNLLGRKYCCLIGGSINLKLFLLIFALANLLLVLFTLLIYPCQGVL